MRIREVDEESISSEHDGPTFRAYLYWRRGSSFECAVFEVVDADASETIQWASQQVADHYAVALVVLRDDQLHAHWIQGTDPNRNSPRERF